MSVKPIPEGYHSVTPYLIIDGATEALEFYKKAFGARETLRLDAPGGKIGHAEIMIGDFHIMLADEMGDMGFKGPKAYGGTPVSLMVYVEDVDFQFQQATKAGAKVLRAVTNQFYGDRNGQLEDPFGHIWTFSTHVEDVSPEEIERRLAKLE